MVQRVDAQGRLIRILGPGPTISQARVQRTVGLGITFTLFRPLRSRDATIWGCRDIAYGAGGFPAVSPDGKRVAFVLFEKHGPMVKWTGVDCRGPAPGSTPRGSAAGQGGVAPPGRSPP